MTPRSKKRPTKGHSPVEKPLSLAPLTLDEALAGLLQTAPPPKRKAMATVNRKRARKAGRKAKPKG